MRIIAPLIHTVHYCYKSPTQVIIPVLYLYFYMGTKPSRSVPPPQKQQEPPQRQLTPLQRWEQSEQNHEDLALLLESSPTCDVWVNAVHQFLQPMSSREKYQNYVIMLLDFLRSQPCRERYGENERRELFTLFSSKLKHSFFIPKDFRESHMDCKMSPRDKLRILFEYYSQSEEQLQKAIFFNYPTIFTEFRHFLRELVQSEVLVSDQLQLCRLVVPLRKIEEIKEYFELVADSYTPSEREKLFEEVRCIQDMREVYVGGVEELLRYDYADLACTLLRNVLGKGYELSSSEYQLYLKAEIYSLLLYQLNKLTLQYEQVGRMSTNDLLHYFFTNYDMSDTPLLITCFHIFPNPQERWEACILAYIFSENSHISTMIRLMQKKLIQLEGKQELFPKIVGKIRDSSCEIGRYCEELTNLALCFDITHSLKQQYLKLVKLIEICYLFNMNSDVQTLYELAFADWEGLASGELMALEEKGLGLLGRLISGYFKEFGVKTKSIEIEEQCFQFSSVFEMLRFIQWVSKYFLHSYVSSATTHQIFFRELIGNERYIEIKALMSEERQLQFGIHVETIEMIVSDHIIALLTTKKVRKTEESLRLLLSILRLYPLSPQNSSHYLVCYYNYIKYLQERDVVLPHQMKENITTENLYFIVNHYQAKMESIDFNYLFTLQSAIKMQYTDHVLFLPVITDEFLKFKVYLCNKAYSTKRHKLGSDTIEEVIKYEPPWISTELVNILKENSNIESSFIAIAFNYCARGEDLELILDLYEAKDKGKSSKLSLLNLKSWKTLLEEDKYLVLTDELVINQSLYKNHVAELTFSEDQTLKTTHYLFFHLLTIEPSRSFNYAVNYNMPATFVLNFMLEAAKKSIVHIKNITPYLIRYLYFMERKAREGLAYVSKREYQGKPLEEIISRCELKGDSYLLLNLQRMRRSYRIQKILTEQFLQLYLNSSVLFQFLYEEPSRKKILVDLRQQPMAKNNAKVLRMLCEESAIDIVEISIYNLVSQVNSKEVMTSECWTIAQKLIFWGEERSLAYAITQKLSQKIEILSILVSLVDYLRESEPNYKEFITDYHLDILRSLAAVQNDKDLFGIIPDNFFQRPVGVYPLKNRGIISETHRRILKESACIENIFVLSKCLYFIYGCNDQIEKIVLGEFSLQQEDCEEFEMLRKKVKLQKQE